VSTSRDIGKAQSLKKWRCGIGFVHTKRDQIFFSGVLTTLISRSPREGVDKCRDRALNASGLGYYCQAIVGRAAQGGKGDSRDTSNFVTSCPIGVSLPADSSCEGRVSLHFTQSGLSIPTAAGVVVERGSEYILARTGPRVLNGHPLGGCGSGFGLVPGYTTLSVRVRANT